MWYQRLFGDTDTFAVQVTFVDDPHPHPGTPRALSASWGRLTLWVSGRCLTQSSRGGTIHDAIEWYLLPLVQWAAREAVPLLNEEPFPQPTRRSEVATAIDWLSMSEEPPWSLTQAEEFDWLIKRSDWQRRHALWHGFDGAVVPSVMLRRLGHDVEISWDNETWPPSRRDLRFTELTGAARLPAEVVGRVWGEFVEAIGSRIRSRLGDAMEAATLTLTRPTAADWKWLVPSNVAGFIERDPSARTLFRELRDVAESARLVVPHRLETLLLRHCAAATDADLRMILGLRSRSGHMSEDLQHLRSPRPAPASKPWLDGYEMALAVRSALGWQDEPAPADLAAWCEANSIDLMDREGSSQIDSVVVSCVGHRPLIDLNPSGGAIRRWSPRFMTAAGLGMLLLDTTAEQDFGFVFGAREDWPSAARARAFAAMLLMPVDGVRRSLDDFGRKSMNALMDGVRAIMSRFGTSAQATTYHLKNLGFISDEERVDVVTALATG